MHGLRRMHGEVSGQELVRPVQFGVAPTTAINIPFPQAIPKKAKIDPQFCRQFLKGKCGVCAKMCPTKAINYEMQDEIVTEEVGAIVVASGYGLLGLEMRPSTGADVIPTSSPGSSTRGS